MSRYYAHSLPPPHSIDEWEPLEEHQQAELPTHGILFAPTNFDRPIEEPLSNNVLDLTSTVICRPLIGRRQPRLFLVAPW